MAEIQCPQCGTLISLQQSDLDSVVKQVRDEEFRKELEERTRLIEAEKRKAVELAHAEAKAVESEHIAALKEKAAAELAKAKEDLVKARAEGEDQASKAEARLSALEIRKDAEIERLQSQLQSQETLAASQQELAISKAVAALEKERDALSASLELQAAEQARIQATLKEQMASQLKVKEDVIAYQREEIERIKDMRARLTTKLVGESLEQHCQCEFDRVRSMAFPNAYFEKDNAVVDGTKGDFIFRECDEDGNEIISIMFEMKNEEDGSTAKKRNEDHLPKLHKDRLKKKCEYAVLVSLLEPESDLYNEGIVDVSHKFPRMYVIRPQFFIPLISLLRNAALGSLQYKRELALVRQQEMDITTFEQDLDTFKQGFFKNYSDASLRFSDAVAAIDKAIADLQKAKDKLLVSERHLTSANHKLESLTVKKLVRKNPTMKEKFEALREAREQKGPGVQEEAEVPEEEPKAGTPKTGATAKKSGGSTGVAKTAKAAKAARTVKEDGAPKA